MQVPGCNRAQSIPHSNPNSRRKKMSRQYNKITFVGHLGGEPEMRVRHAA
jgi:hypothetical protein